MPRTLSNAELRTDRARIHVYTYRYETPSHQSRSPGQDVLALFHDQARGATGVFRHGETVSRVFPLGGLMIVPRDTSISATGPGGDRRLAVCTMTPGLLPDDFDCRDQASLALCGDIHDAHVRATMQRLAEEAIAPGFGADVLVDALSTALRTDLARYFRRSLNQEPVRVGTLAPWQLRRIEDYLHGCDSGRMRIADLAEVAEISAGHLTRTFKKTTGRTVHQFVEQVRLARARVMLSETQLPLKQIAAQLGFGTPSSFSLAFRRATGATPGRYREERSRLN